MEIEERSKEIERNTKTVRCKGFKPKYTFSCNIERSSLFFNKDEDGVFTVKSADGVVSEIKASVPTKKIFMKEVESYMDKHLFDARGICTAFVVLSFLFREL